MYESNDMEHSLPCTLHARDYETLEIMPPEREGRIFIPAPTLPATSSQRAQGASPSGAPDFANADTASASGKRRAIPERPEMQRSGNRYVFRSKREVVLMFSHQPTQVKPSVIVVAILLISSPICLKATPSGAEQVCNVSADYALGIEDYGEAIRLHREILRKNPGNALARYHLGFAEGMIGNSATEVDEYRRAEVLGLRIWDLFLNLGLAELERGDLYAATDSLQRAVLLGGEHSEPHFNLALVEERRGMLANAEHETLASLLLNPGQPDARNLLAVIYVQEGKTIRASLVWRELVRDVPDYQPARTNLALLGNQNEVVLGETAAVALPPAAAVEAINSASRRRWQASEIQPNPRPSR
jgi:Flp pilus assembly protein TadD